MIKFKKGLCVLLLLAACMSIGYASGAVRPPEKAPPRIEMLAADLTVVNSVQRAFEIVATTINYSLSGVGYVEVIALELPGEVTCELQSPVAVIEKQCLKVVEKYLGCERYYSCRALAQVTVNDFYSLPNYHLRT